MRLTISHSVSHCVFYSGSAHSHSVSHRVQDVAMMSAKCPLNCSAVELWYKIMLEIRNQSDLTENHIKRKAAGYQRLSSNWLWLVTAVSKPSLADALTVYESIRPTKLYSRSYDPYTDSSVIEFGINLKMAKKNQDTIAGNTINNCSVLAAFGNCNVGKTKLNDVYGYFAKQVKDVLAPGMLLSGYVKRHLDKDKDGNLKKFILNFLKDSDFNIEDVTLHEEEELITPELEQLIQKAPIADDAKSEMLKKGKITNTELTFTHRTGNGLYELSEEYESNGTMRFLGMAIILNFLLKNNQFVPIDEVETSIHYELLSYFIKVFLANSNQTSQMLLTTHDINLLNEEFIRRDTIWFTDKDEQGETNVVRLSALGLHKNLSPYNAYKQGKLVKLPFLGSQYFDLND